MDGINGTIMTYGQTGSGKTFTMMGDTQNYQHRGIAPRALSQIFQEVAMRIETQFTISVRTHARCWCAGWWLVGLSGRLAGWLTGWLGHGLAGRLLAG